MAHETLAKAEDPRLGTVLGGRFRLVAPLGSGAMGVVYEGVQEGLGRRVAVKCLHPHLGTSQDFVTRFMMEARVASRLSHPNVVRVFDFGTHQEGGMPGGPLLYLVMELCSGASLGSLLSQGAVFPLSRVASIMSQVLAALGEAHDHGIVHRDVKPDNVILEPKVRGGDVVKLIDFGIAEAKADGPRVAGGIAGTPQYLSPEVIRGEEADHQADLYAAGALLFELVTGKEVFDGETVHEILQKQLAAPRPDPRVVAPERHILDELAELCIRAVAIDRAERFVDADAFADALAKAIAAPPSRPPIGSVQPKQQLHGAPPISAIAATGRYSIRPGEDRLLSGERLAASPGSAFWLLQELEADASTAMAARKWPLAITKLREGLRLAGDLVTAGESEMGSAALTSFGRKLGEAFRRGDAPQESFDVLVMTLERAPEGELTRALLLEELGLSAMKLARRGDAVGAWLDAAEIARAAGNTAVERRLLGRIEGDTR